MIKIPFSEPNLSHLEREYLADAFDSSWIGGKGDFIDKFEARFAKYIGVDHAVTCSNGTTALHLAYLACGMRNSSTVTVPKNTFAATQNMAGIISPKVTLADSQEETWTLDLKSESDFVVGVHLYGNPCDMGQVYRSKSVFIEDCAQSLGSTYRNKQTGSFGTASTFSFHSSKTITTGEGGMVCTNDYGVAEQVRFLKNQSMVEPYIHPHIGFNYRMTNLQAAVGLAQLERIDELVYIKKDITDFYNDNLNKNYIRQKDTKHSKVVHWANAYKHSNAPEIRKKLLEAGIETRPGFIEGFITFPCSTKLIKRDLEIIVEEANKHA